MALIFPRNYVSACLIFRMCLLCCAFISTVSPSFAVDDVADDYDVKSLLGYYVAEFEPETALLVIQSAPDNTGQFTDVYMSLEGVMIETLRLNRLNFRMKGVQFNKPSEWAKGNVECKSAIQILAMANLLEKDINRAIETKTFGDDGSSEWHDVSMKITPEGLSGKGYYRAGFLDILLEIDSGLKIVKGKELWLKDPKVKVNTLDVPDYITRKALNDIQPLVDLNKFPLPLTLHKVELKNGSATLSTRTLPQEPSDGIRYTYSKQGR